MERDHGKTYAKNSFISRLGDARHGDAGDKIDDEGKRRFARRGKLHKSQTAQFDQTGESRRRGCEEACARFAQGYLIVGDEAGFAARVLPDKPKGEIGLART